MRNGWNIKQISYRWFEVNITLAVYPWQCDIINAPIDYKGILNLLAEVVCPWRQLSSADSPDLDAAKTTEPLVGAASATDGSAVLMAPRKKEENLKK